ncbi:MAG: hypothetical protein IH624_14985 [Phycisphaerae bacterium]|nr:hypothetical protein [Phycisphaerae bacterium]
MNEKLTNLINKLPDPDDRGFMSNIDKQVADEVTAGILAGGAENIEAVVGALKVPAEGGDHKARYALHCVAIAVGKDQDEQRQMVAATLAKCVGGDMPKGVKAYLVQELQMVGTPAEAETLGGLLCDEDLCEPAAQALMAIRRGAADQFEKALPNAGPKCKPTIEQNLAILQQRRRRRQ